MSVDRLLSCARYIVRWHNIRHNIYTLKFDLHLCGRNNVTEIYFKL